MNGETLIWFVFAFFFVPLMYADSQYECGVHGKFEYCIDDIPGCVVGCHCHPGFYFDTDSKICEPNVKLTQDFRRHYLSEPTRVLVAPTHPPEELTTNSNAVDEKIDEIAKDADDLGDWLYNQFFKTIENQVINKTQGEELPPTRRSSNDLLNKPDGERISARRSHKYWRKRKNKKRKSKHSKGKLLRITENDSLFDSDSSSVSEDDSSDSSSESDVSSSVDDKREPGKVHDHGHKKILIYNKRPQPPLPSFIFLPNMNTPYYPPIGLPPPPVMPMYPMVPVPPMMPGPSMGGPLFPYPGVPPSCDEDVTSSAATTDSSSHTTISTSELILTSPTTPASTPTTLSTVSTELEPALTTLTDVSPTDDEDTAITTTKSPGLRHRKHKNKKKTIRMGNNEQGNLINPLIRGNQDFLKKLREKLNEDTPLNEHYPAEFVPNPNAHPISANMHEMPAPPPDVNFKYLTELIHKADLNKTLNSPPNHIIIPENVPFEPGRRSYYPINNGPGNTVMRQRSRMEDQNNSFYTNLGKQIASMIRKIDSKGEREVNIEIKGDSSKPQSSLFSGNNYASRSYWDRSVRSPLNYVGNFFKDEMDPVKKSNEDLFSLENKVAIAASTTPTLSLRDLENIVKTVKKKQLHPKANSIFSKRSEHSNSSFKFNLLPGKDQMTQPIDKAKPVLEKKLKQDSDNIHKPVSRRKQSDDNSFLLSNFRLLSPDYETITNTGTRKDLIRNMGPTKQPTDKNKPNVSLPVTRQNRNMIVNFMTGTANKTNPQYQLSPVQLNHRSYNYHPQNINQYAYEKALPIQYTGLTKRFMPYGKFGKQSYFHHEFHNFDYFE